jgi:hypothetical protein
MVSHNTVFKLTEIKLIYYLSPKTSRVQILKIKKKSGPVRFKNLKKVVVILQRPGLLGDFKQNEEK